MSTVRYETTDGVLDANGPSPVIWASCPVDEFIEDAAKGFHTYHNFGDAGIVVDTSIDGFNLFGTGADIDWRGDAIVDLETGAVDNDGCYIGQRPVLPLLALDNGKPFWFECRVANDDIGDNAMLFGLIEAAGQVEGAVVDDCAALISEDYVCFRVLNTDTDGLDAVYRQGGSAEVPVVEEAQVMVEGTYYRLGITYDGVETVTFYVDGLVVGSFSVDSLTNDTMANKLGVILGGKVGTAAVESRLVDWVRLAGVL